MYHAFLCTSCYHDRVGTSTVKVPPEDEQLDCVETCRRCQQNKIQKSASGWFYYTTTLRLGYKNQPVNAVQGNNGWLFPDPHKTHKCTLWTECGLFEC